VDWKSAYRRLHLAINLVVQSGVCIAVFLLLALRMNFGGNANPSRWSDVNELTCDMANDLRTPGWDPDKHKSPHQVLIGEAVDIDPYDVPLAQASRFTWTCRVMMSPKQRYTLTTRFCAFLEKDLKRGRAVLPFVLYMFGRRVDGNEPLPREDILSLKKCIEEATPAELKIILGWEIDARRLLISLPSHKVVGWSASIRAILSGR
jgi:hypothetical protein